MALLLILCEVLMKGMSVWYKFVLTSVHPHVNIWCISMCEKIFYHGSNELELSFRDGMALHWEVLVCFSMLWRARG